MNSKERRLYLDEIYMLGEQKEFKASLVSVKKSINGVLNPFAKWGKGALENHRKAYNYTFVQICDKYCIENNDEIFSQLDQIWNSFGLDNGPQILLRVLSPVRVAEIAGAWVNYIDKTRKLAEDISDIGGKDVREV